MAFTSCIDHIMGIYPHKVILGFQEVRAIHKGVTTILDHCAEVTPTHMLVNGHDCGYTYSPTGKKMLVIEVTTDVWLVYKVVR